MGEFGVMVYTRLIGLAQIYNKNVICYFNTIPSEECALEYKWQGNYLLALT
jgi:hypothetical protein